MKKIILLTAIFNIIILEAISQTITTSRKISSDDMSTLNNTYAPKASPIFTGIVSGITSGMVGLSNVENTTDLNKPISTATGTALGNKVNIVAGKQLSTNDFTNVYKNRSDSLSYLFFLKVDKVVGKQLSTNDYTNLEQSKLYAKMDSTRVNSLLTSKQNTLNGIGLVKANGTTITYDNTTYLTSSTIANKLQTVTSIALLQAYTDANYAYFDGSNWEKKTGANIASNGGSAAGTIINVSSIYYWERKYENKISVLWFGGIGDGTTDNTNAITTANAYCASIGKILYFPVGVYVSQTLSVQSNTRFEGESKTNSILKLLTTTATNNVNNALISTNNKSGISISNLTLDGNNAHIGQVVLIICSGATSLITDFNFDNVIVKNQSEHIYFVGDNTHQIKNVSITNSLFDTAESVNVEFRGVVGLNISNSTFTNWATVGVNGSKVNYVESLAFNSDCSNIKIDKCNFLNTVSNEFAIEAPAGAIINNISVTNCLFDAGGKSGGNGISGNFNNAIFNNNAHINGVNISLTYELYSSIGNVTISNTTINSGQISLVNGNNFTINNIISTVSGQNNESNIAFSKVNNVLVSNCIFTNTAAISESYGIYIGYSGIPNFANGVKIKDCQINVPTGKTGIKINAIGYTANDLTITGNYFNGGNGVYIANNSIINCEISNNDFSKLTTAYTSDAVLTSEFKIINNTYSINKNSLTINSNLSIGTGTGTPNSAIYAGIGSLFLENTSGLIYVKSTANTFNTGWNASLTGNQTITFAPTGDVTGTTSGTTSLNPVLTLGTVTQGAGTSFSKINIDSKGRVIGNTTVGSSDITNALGFTPYNSTNPNGYISSASGAYFPITGGRLTGTTGAGFVSFPNQSANPSTPTNGFSLFANSAGALSWKGQNGFTRTFDGTTNTADWVYGLPNANGMLALLGINQIWTGTSNNFTGNVGIGSATTPVEKLEVAGNLALTTIGSKLKIATGTNASLGTATLVAGQVTVNTTAVKTGSQVWIQYSQMSGTGTTSILTTSSITDSTSFSVNAITAGSALNSTNSSDNNQIKWLIIN